MDFGNGGMNEYVWSWISGENEEGKIKVEETFSR
jgi:hypothetical protein